MKRSEDDMYDDIDDLTPLGDGDVEDFLCSKRKDKDLKVIFEKADVDREEKVFVRVSIIDVWKDAAGQLLRAARKMIGR